MCLIFVTSFQSFGKNEWPNLYAQPRIQILKVISCIYIHIYLKFIYSEKATKILRNLPLTFDNSTYGQKLGEDFAKFCGLLRIYELYQEVFFDYIILFEPEIS